MADRLVDTDVFSFVFKNHTRAQDYLPHLTGRLCISFITVGELYFWAEKRNWGETKRAALEERMKRFVVLKYDVEVARAFGRLRADMERNGHQGGINDLWIGATALAYGCDLVTNNRRHFEPFNDLTVISEG